MKTKWIKYRNARRSLFLYSLIRKPFCAVLYLLLIFPILGQSAIYQKINADGKQYFSDIPTIDSSLINLKSANIYSSTPSTKNPLSLDAGKQKNTAKKYYQKFILTQPGDQENFHNQQEISAAVQIDPALQPGDTIEWWLDGKRYQQNANAQITIQSLERGKHTLQAKIWDAKNHILLTTQIVIFYIHF